MPMTRESVSPHPAVYTVKFSGWVYALQRFQKSPRAGELSVHVRFAVTFLLNPLSPNRIGAPS